MDAASYEDLAWRLYGLVIRLSDRLPADQAGMLACGKIAATDQERGDMLALARQMGMDDLVGQALRSCARAGEVQDRGA